MNFYGDPITRLIEKFASLPGIGRKSAQRLAFYVIGMDEKDVQELADAILSAKKDVKYCSVCCNLTDGDICPVCSLSLIHIWTTLSNIKAKRFQKNLSLKWLE